MNNLLWIAQGMLAIAFFYSGLNKSIYSEKQLIAKGQTGVVNLSTPFIRFIGITEIAGAIGVIVPWLLNIMPVLTPVSAIGFCVIMIPAAVIHTRLKEPKNVATNVFLFALSVFVIWGRI